MCMCICVYMRIYAYICLIYVMWRVLRACKLKVKQRACAGAPEKEEKLQGEVYSYYRRSPGVVGWYVCKKIVWRYDP